MHLVRICMIITDSFTYLCCSANAFSGAIDRRFVPHIRFEYAGPGSAVYRNAQVKRSKTAPETPPELFSSMREELSQLQTTVPPPESPVVAKAGAQQPPPPSSARVGSAAAREEEEEEEENEEAADEGEDEDEDEEEFEEGEDEEQEEEDGEFEDEEEDAEEDEEEDEEEAEGEEKEPTEAEVKAMAEKAFSQLDFTRPKPRPLDTSRGAVAARVRSASTKSEPRTLRYREGAGAKTQLPPEQEQRIKEFELDLQKKRFNNPARIPRGAHSSRSSSPRKSRG
jgi:hypothetical protein